MVVTEIMRDGTIKNGRRFFIHRCLTWERSSGLIASVPKLFQGDKHMFKMISALTALLVASGFGYNFTNLKVRDIEASGSDPAHAFYIVYFENEPDFEGAGSGTQGVGFYDGSSISKSWLSVFETALSMGSSVDLLVDIGSGPDHTINPYKWYCNACGTASLLRSVKLHR
jgi:hypothetical protein